MLASRSRLEAVYASDLPVEAMRRAKQAEFERLRRDYRQLRDRHWPGDMRYEAWISAPLNNARLLPFGLYDQWLPAFAALFERASGDWAAFYQRAAELGELPLIERERALAALAGSN